MNPSSLLSFDDIIPNVETLFKNKYGHVIFWIHQLECPFDIIDGCSLKIKDKIFNFQKNLITNKRVLYIDGVIDNKKSIKLALVESVAILLKTKAVSDIIKEQKFKLYYSLKSFLRSPKL